MGLHFKAFADDVIQNYISDSDPFVVEIGSNDGIMLKNFARAGIRHLGVEPSSNVAADAREKGVNTRVSFFDQDCAAEIVAEHGQADAFIAANVMCHIPYFHSIVEGIKLLLKPQGVAIFEDPYLGDVIENTTYDQIYDEHTFLFSLQSIKYIFEQHDMELFHVEHQETHGGSMRYFIGHKAAHQATKALKYYQEKKSSWAYICQRLMSSFVKIVNAIKKN